MQKPTWFPVAKDWFWASISWYVVMLTLTMALQIANEHPLTTLLEILFVGPVRASTIFFSVIKDSPFDPILVLGTFMLLPFVFIPLLAGMITWLRKVMVRHSWLNTWLRAFFCWWVTVGLALFVFSSLNSQPNLQSLETIFNGALLVFVFAPILDIEGIFRGPSYISYEQHIWLISLIFNPLTLVPLYAGIIHLCEKLRKKSRTLH